MDIKKWLLPVALVIIIGAYIVYRQFSGNPTTKAPIVSSQNTSANVQPAITPSTQTGFKDGQYTGSVANAFYGNVQVQATISGGKITDIELLTYPNHPGHTLDVSNSALPTLKSEAIQSQSANVNIVSGATQTSQAFMQSLASALTQAGATGQPNIQVTPPPHMGA